MISINIFLLDVLMTIFVLLGVASGKLLLFDGLAGSFRNIRLRSRDLNCAVCGDHPTIKELVNYETFCGVTASDKTPSLKLLPNDDRYTPEVSVTIITRYYLLELDLKTNFYIHFIV